MAVTNNWLPPVDRFDTFVMGWVGYALLDGVFFDDSPPNLFFLIFYALFLVWMTARLWMNREVTDGD